ncbi:Alcohol dehydrogenase-like 5 [Vigna angularis]|uniref:Alcohol dehydrogenase-like 5 n=1 Tax=Phaseolus angularis TaxID=3914 RepID=A0A8T0KEV6_PHAAN|nr:8-hydroxygeraniol oxidoreductase [Vigna angularis]KAG2398154.1 Alcohol dehydrogenase-like 5 [Vigna angularis]
MSRTSQVVTCKAAICWGLGQPVTVEEIQVDPPKATEVRVKMICSSLCHTDITSIQGFPHMKFPRALGHEGVGVVESVGDQVTTLKEGDVVIPTYIGECETCENCVSGQTNLCLTHPVSLTGLLPDDTSRMSIRGQRLYHVLSCATWSEYMVSDVNYVLKVDPTIDPTHASFISCGFSTGFGAAWKEAKVESGSSVAVLGLGAVGLGAISGAKFMGAAKIIGIDKNEKKREKGEAFGMTHFINPTDSAKSVSELVKEATGGMGVDYSIECTGIPPLLTESLEATKVGTGKTVVVGIPAEPTVPLGIITILLGRTLKGSVFGGLKVRSDLSIIADKCQKKEFPLEELLSHEVPLEDVKKAFEILKEPNCLKIVIKMSH